MSQASLTLSSPGRREPSASFLEIYEARIRRPLREARSCRNETESGGLHFKLLCLQALDGGESLSSALLRNVYQKQQDKKGQAETLARYVTR